MKLNPMLNIIQKNVGACCLIILCANVMALPTINVNVNDSEASEAGPNTGSITITRSGDVNLETALKVFYLAEGTATWTENQSGSDYILAPYGLQARPNLISVSISTNKLSVTVTLTPNQDNRIEGVETAILTLQGASKYTLGNDTEAQVDINDDVAEISISSTDAVAAESGPGTANFTISRTNQGDVSKSMRVYYVAEGTATWTESQNTSDYILAPYGLQGRPNVINVIIPENKLSVSVILTPRFDDVEEGDEEAVLTILDRDIYNVGSPSSQSIIIIDFRQLVFKDSFEILKE
jgi:hypothetical protein